MILKMIRKNKKAVIGETLSWMVATLIVFFIMMLFVIATFTLFGEQHLTMQKNEITFYEEKGLEDLIKQKELIQIFNLPVFYNNQDLTLKDLIIKWKLTKEDSIKLEIEKNVKNFFKDIENCYLFRVNYDVNNLNQDNIWISNSKDDSSLYYLKKADLSKKVSSLNIFIGNQKINLELYTGKCF